jgi:chaperonin GroES
MNQLVPLNGHVVLKSIETMEETVGNIIIPDLGKERPEMGEVVEVSGIFNYHSHDFVANQVEKGDVVLIPKMGSQRVVIEGQEYYIVKQTEILAIVK